MYIGKDRKLFDEISDPIELAKRVPAYGRHFDGMAEFKKAIEEATIVKTGSMAHGLTAGGNLQRLGTIPIGLWAVIEELEPGFFSKRSTFYPWLNKNPTFRVGRTVIR